jgi:hypothetical protein
MMNRLFRVVLVLCLPTIAVAGVVMSNNRANPRPSYEMALGEYIVYRHAATMPTPTIKQYAQARMPQNFRPDMSKVSFGNSTYYRTDRRYDKQADTQGWSLTMTATTVPTLTRMDYRPTMPLPYPPNELWCVQLSSSDPAAPKVVVVGLHQDIYNAEWIVHEVTDPETVLAAVGCKFSAQ